MGKDRHDLNWLLLALCSQTFMQQSGTCQATHLGIPFRDQGQTRSQSTYSLLCWSSKCYKETWDHHH